MRKWRNICFKMARLFRVIFFTVHKICVCFLQHKKNTWLSLSHFIVYSTKSDQPHHGLFTIHSSSHYSYSTFLVCPFLFHFCELVCLLCYSSMNLLASAVKFLNMLLCFYLNSSLLHASTRIRNHRIYYNSTAFTIWLIKTASCKHKFWNTNALILMHDIDPI